ncbi:MAG: hypothetical protein QW393_04795, partial [Candidatus Micrarchaeaceae archaeon]
MTATEQERKEQTAYEEMLDELSRKYKEKIEERREGVIDDETMSLSAFVPPRMRESYVYLRNYLIKTTETSSYQERMANIKFGFENRMRNNPKYAFLFEPQNKKMLERVEEIIEEHYRDEA